MYDIDAGRSYAIRLDSPRASSADEEIAAIKKQMEALSLRHCELMEAKRVAFAQARPIRASVSAVIKSVSTERISPEMSRDAQASRNLGHVGIPGNIAVSADNDFWNHRNRVMAGTTPMIARSAGHIDRMTAAAAGEIEDPAAGLRRERN